MTTKNEQSPEATANPRGRTLKTRGETTDTTDIEITPTWWQSGWTEELASRGFAAVLACNRIVTLTATPDGVFVSALMHPDREDGAGFLVRAMELGIGVPEWMS